MKQKTCIAKILLINSCCHSPYAQQSCRARVAIIIYSLCMTLKWKIADRIEGGFRMQDIKDMRPINDGKDRMHWHALMAGSGDERLLSYHSRLYQYTTTQLLPCLLILYTRYLVDTIRHLPRNRNNRLDFLC